MFNAGL
ncbi:hypothetical protein VCHC28A1_1535, partial [Vibrio cholerae HC-28A1]